MQYSLKLRDLIITQDTNLQSFTLDSVLVADYVKINRKLKKILDIGSGNGVISMLLAKKSTAKITAVEILESSHNLALKNFKNNNLDIEAINCDIKEYLKGEQQIFDAIVSNPPYFKIPKKETQMKNKDELKIARHETNLTLTELINISSRLLKNNGHLYLVFRTERLNDILDMLKNNNLAAKSLKFVYTRENANSLLTLLDAKKGAKQELVIEPPLYINEGEISE